MSYRWSAAWMASLGIAMMMALSLAAPASAGVPTAATPARGAGVLTAIVVQKCPTGLAIPPQPLPRLPASLKMHVPAQYLGKLSVYADEIGTKMLAPVGWSCTAQYGADGTGGMTVYPPRSSLSPNSEQVDATTTGRCGTCAEGVACGMFKSAAAAFVPPLPGAKCQPRPAGESVVHLSANIVAFEVPPHTAGEVSYPDNGVLTYYPSPNSVPLTWQGDCIVPAGLHQLCTAILNQFIVWDGGPYGPGSEQGHA
jgi:hypothetical protein